MAYETRSLVKETSDTDIEAMADYLIITYSGRVLRSVAYMVIAILLLRENQFGVEFTWGLVAAFGLFGLSFSNARIAQFGLFVLFLMALIPLDAIKAIVAAA